MAASRLAGAGSCIYIPSMTTTTAVAESCACLRVRKAARNVTRRYDAALRPAGLRITQFTVMTALAEYGEVSITDLAESLGMERTTLTRNARFVRYGSGMGRGAEGHAEYPAETVSKFYRMSAEATACGTFFAVWWRMTHIAENGPRLKDTTKGSTEKRNSQS